MKKINWEIFFGNSSTEDALSLFAIGIYSFKDFSKNCWQKECKQEIKILKQRGYKRARKCATSALNRRGFSLKEL